MIINSNNRWADLTPPGGRPTQQHYKVDHSIGLVTATHVVRHTGMSLALTAHVNISSEYDDLQNKTLP